ncbi:hypothetical protein, partial [Bifidobacterium dentium]|uniref:hypothetical protein n=1 Tax=Bifidobacterium dentium TaxID=1689 RepID=UPI003219441C
APDVMNKLLCVESDCFSLEQSWYLQDSRHIQDVYITVRCAPPSIGPYQSSNDQIKRQKTYPHLF